MPPPPGEAPDRRPGPRVDVARVVHGLQALDADPDPVLVLLQGIGDVLVPAAADRCVVELFPREGRAGMRTEHGGDVAERLTPIFAPPARSATARRLVRRRDRVSVGFVTAGLAEPSSRGSVTCRWDDGHVPTEQEAELIQLVVDHCVLVLYRQRLAESLRSARLRAGTLQNGVRDTLQTGAAVGVLMARYGLSQERATDLLHRSALSGGRSMGETGETVLRTGELPGGIRPPAGP
ncbi:ANTAR domain-containing protein [Nakamurella flavida]|uniref:ANTAR domain-containing protein n=1 Tax=Nakamurella flavida TaxID=363630 RepID=UPI0027D77187|nr:ANTAR domain-containing protein [Nakamurella flavida]